MIHDFKIILMDFNGELLYEYFSPIVPAVDDTILIDDERSFVVSARHFSTMNFKVVLLGDIDHAEATVEEIKKINEMK